MIPDVVLDDVLVRIRGLTVTFSTEEGLVPAVQGVDLDLRAGRTLGLVGESGSGKSVTSLALMRLLPSSAKVTASSLCVLGRELSGVAGRDAERVMRQLRGKDVAMIFQEPMTSLNPVYTAGEQVIEAILEHEPVGRRDARARTVALFEEVGLTDAVARLGSYPHQLSGGQKQRVMIAMALACNPRVLIADEPTTALDVTIQAQILDLLRSLRDRRGLAMLFITHDLGVVAQIADDVAVMHRGAVVEYGPVAELLRSPEHAYTRALLACRPALGSTPRRPLPTPNDAAPLLDVKDLTVQFTIRAGIFQRVVGQRTAVDAVSLSVFRGQTLGLVGESGCGKTTLGRAIVRLIAPSAGSVRFAGRDLLAAPTEELRKLRREIQMIFQDPYSSLNPRMSVCEHLTEPMAVHGIGVGAAERLDRAEALLLEVGLSADHLGRYPHEFSGGQRQRVGIARALAVGPSLLICDEAVSALDVTIAARVLDLLRELQEKRGLTYLFISHDLAVVHAISDTVAVMQAGRIVEMGASEQIYREPQQDYTRRLIAAIPAATPRPVAGR